MRPLNVASQPFRNETLPAILFGTAAVLLVAATIEHALVVRALLPARTSKLHKEVAALEAETERLRAEGRTLTAPKPDKHVIAEWNVLKDLVDRRTFSWTGLFARLEQVLPREVRLVSIAPNVEHGQVSLDITALARPAQAGLGLVGLFEQRAEFEDVYPVSVSEQDGGGAEFAYTMRYLPGATSDAALLPVSQVEADEVVAEPTPEPSAAPQPPQEQPSERSGLPSAKGLEPAASKEAPSERAAPPAAMRPEPPRPSPQRDDQEPSKPTDHRQ